MKILAIDPGSAKIASSTNGIVLLDNARLVNHWVVPSAKVQDIRNWFEEVGRFLDVDVVVLKNLKLETMTNQRIIQFSKTSLCFEFFSQTLSCSAMQDIKRISRTNY